MVVSFLSFLTVAPKKSIPSKNLISRHGSSSTSSPSIRDRFCDSKSQQNFDENLSDKAIYSEHHVILSDFLDTSLVGVLSFRGWESLYRKPIRCPSVFI